MYKTKRDLITIVQFCRILPCILYFAQGKIKNSRFLISARIIK